LRFSTTAQFKILCHDIEHTLQKFSIRAKQMYDDLCLLMNGKAREATLEKIMKMMTKQYSEIKQVMNTTQETQQHIKELN